MENLDKDTVEKQRKKVFGKQPRINLIRPCRLNDGILSHSDFEKKGFRMKFGRSEQKVHFFIPASGVGSRMFKFLYQFLHHSNPEVRSKTERFLNAIEEFAFFELLPYKMKKKVKEYDIGLDELISYIVDEEGLNLGELPKGMVPFHKSRSFILNAFQEQLLQGLNVKEGEISFHFTINKAHEKVIKDTLLAIRQLTGREFTIDWSEQSPKTHSIAFDMDGNIARGEDDAPILRPSGHGALLDNLNAIDSELIFVKNIDNVQQENKAHSSIEHLQYLGGMMIEIKSALKEAMNGENVRLSLDKLNQIYQLTDQTTNFKDFSDKEIDSFIHRPIRICGMVRNEGQAGGGPFWVNEKGRVSKQIVEKSQIDNEEQYRMMVQSKYFNPVIMALSTRDIEGNRLDLNKFADFEKYFIVEKSHYNHTIKYLERPGLWNGSMANWITVFVEVPSSIFTPVKTVLDLLDNAHIE